MRRHFLAPPHRGESGFDLFGDHGDDGAEEPEGLAAGEALIESGFTLRLALFVLALLLG